MPALTDAIALRVPGELKDKIDNYAKAARLKRSEFLLEVIVKALDIIKVQVEHIGIGLLEADGGEFASQEELARIKNKWNAL